MFKKLASSLILIVALWPASLSAQTSTTPTRAQAIQHLTQLIDVYGISLSQSETETVISVCRQIQTSDIQGAASALSTKRQTYTNAVNSIDLSIRFTANALSQMNEDGSTMDLASFHLSRNMNEFVASLDVFERSLEELLILDCQVFPEQFIAGLEESRFREQVVFGSASKLTSYIDTELVAAFDRVEERLVRVEAQQ